MDDFDDTVFYDQVASELDNNKRKDGLWLKALTLADGDESKVKVHYVRLRVEQLYIENAELVRQDKLKQQRASKEMDDKLQMAEALESRDVVRTHDMRTFSFSHIVFWPSLLFPIWAAVYLIVKGDIKRGIIVFLVSLGIVFIGVFFGKIIPSSDFSIISFAALLGHIYYHFTVSKNINRWLSERAHGIDKARHSSILLEQNDTILSEGKSNTNSADVHGAEAWGQSTSQRNDIPLDLPSDSEQTHKSENIYPNEKPSVVNKIIVTLLCTLCSVSALFMAVTTLRIFQENDAATAIGPALITLTFAALTYFFIRIF